MRHLYNVLLVAAVVGICLSPVIANARPGMHPGEGKPWHYNPGVILTTYPEVEPNNTCDTAQPWACGDEINPAAIDPIGDWDYYVFTANAGDWLTMGTQAIPGMPTVDTYIELWDASCTTELTYNDDGGGNLYSLISNFVAPYTGVYHLKVRAYADAYTGSYYAFLTCTSPTPPPPNDLCSGAIAIDPCSQGSLTGSTALANNDYDPGVPGPSCTGYSEAGRDVVYLLSLSAGNTITVDYTQTAADAALYIVTDCSNITGSCVAGADATFSGQMETLTYTAGSTGTYYLILDSYGTDTGGDWTMDWNINCTPPPPTGACCLPGGTCAIMTQADCEAQGGIYMGNDVPCTPELCNPTAVQHTTWGSVKHLYR